VLQVIPDETRALVQGINLVRRHTKQTASQDAGIFTKPAPIHLSNLSLIDPKSEAGQAEADPCRLQD
jgi:large subunit ribosomal protein L24